MKVKSIAALLCLTAMLGVSGCTTDYKEEDIRNYVKDTLLLTDFSISDTYEEINGEDDFLDKLWTVVDNKNHVTFHVLDDYYWGKESTTNRLRNDYAASVFIDALDELPTTPMTTENKISITAGMTAEGINGMELAAYYENKAEIREVLDLLDAYDAYFINHGFEQVDYSMTLHYAGPASHPYQRQLIGGRSTCRMKSDKESAFESAVRSYILCGLDYCFEEIYADATSEEIQSAIQADNTDRIGIIREDGTIEYYDDLIGNEYSYGLSVSTLYQVLLREGLNPQGNRFHFTCNGPDGTVYEFGYDFYSGQIRDQKGAYYLANGRICYLGRDYNSHIRETTASELFGIQIVRKWNRTIAEEESKKAS